jgi:hypothetical protein
METDKGRPVAELTKEAAEILRTHEPSALVTGAWSALFPEGREIFYEGDNPEEFAATIKAELDFDPSKDNPRWGEVVHVSYAFHCPPEHLDAIYGGDRFPMGS